MTFTADTPLALPLSEPAPPSGPVRFTDRGGLFGLLVKNAVLTFVTLGIYRFWARAALRRYWWGSIVLAGDPLEYTGTGLELFIGFLMFLAIMLPLALVYGLTALLQQSNPLAGALLRLVELLGFFVLIQFVTFRARRYRLSRTLWRGVRASQGGTSGAYLWLVVKWTLISAITFGIAVPWARMAATRYLTDRTALGDLGARFEGRGRDLFLPFFVPYALAIGCFVAFAVLNVLAVRHGGLAMPHGIGFLMLGYCCGLLGFLVYSLIELRYTLGKTRFGEIELGSLFPVGRIVIQIVGFGFAVFVGVLALFWIVLGFFMPMPGAAGAAGAQHGVTFFTVVPAAALFLIVLGLIDILRIYWIDKAIVRELCDTLSMSHPELLDRIGQSTAPVPSAGEGMADAFDIGAAF